jgi:hypothetical protein
VFPDAADAAFRAALACFTIALRLREYKTVFIFKNAQRRSHSEFPLDS